MVFFFYFTISRFFLHRNNNNNIISVNVFEIENYITYEARRVVDFSRFFHEHNRF